VTEPLSATERANVLVPFFLTTLIWGSTWFVIRDQVGVVPPAWSISYRFVIASSALFAYARWQGLPLRLDAGALLFSGIFGLFQFGLNFNFIYHASAYIASGLVAVVFSLMVVPNAVLSKLFLGEGVSRPFMIGSAIALAGIGLLFKHEIEAASAGPTAVLIGIGLTLTGMMSASISNVMQASKRARALSMPVMLAWGMAIAAVLDGLYAWTISGPPTIDLRFGYIAGVLYLGLGGSALAFMLYFGMIRTMGAARAAYSGVLVPIIAMALSTLYEGYDWSLEAAIGCVLALAGLVVALSARRPAR
jgi:drug/metabolite transporter (DMT)-like permease